MKRATITFIVFLFTCVQSVGAELTDEEISAKIAVMDKVSLDCIVVLRDKGLAKKGEVWVACDRYEKRSYEFNKIIKSSPSLSKKDKKRVGYIKSRQPLIKEFSKY